MAEQNPFWRWHVVVSVFVSMSWCDSAIIQKQRLCRYEGAVVAITNHINAKCRQQNRKGVHRFTSCRCSRSRPTIVSLNRKTGKLVAVLAGSIRRAARRSSRTEGKKRSLRPGREKQNSDRNAKRGDSHSRFAVAHVET